MILAAAERSRSAIFESLKQEIENLKKNYEKNEEEIKINEEIKIDLNKKDKIIK